MKHYIFKNLTMCSCKGDSARTSSSVWSISNWQSASETGGETAGIKSWTSASTGGGEGCMITSACAGVSSTSNDIRENGSWVWSIWLLSLHFVLVNSMPNIPLVELLLPSLTVSSPIDCCTLFSDRKIR